ncbi:hypothetical protein MRB53_040306 [Persea americana]|nr:hypothetical protein MRB53_040306 [Persea americana]
MTARAVCRCHNLMARWASPAGMSRGGSIVTPPTSSSTIHPHLIFISLTRLLFRHGMTPAVAPRSHPQAPSDLMHHRLDFAPPSHARRPLSSARDGSKLIYSHPRGQPADRWGHQGLEGTVLAHARGPATVLDVV